MTTGIDDYKIAVLIVAGTPEPFEKTLRDPALRVRYCDSEIQTLEILSTQSHSIVIADVDHLKMNCGEFARLTSLLRHKGNIIAMIFVAPSSWIESHGPTEYEFVDYLEKPLKPALLSAKVNTLKGIFDHYQQINLQAEHLARESEDRFRVMADCAPVLLWMTGTDARCNFFNKPWLEFTGRTLDEEFGYGWAEGVHPEDFSRCMDTFIAAFAERKPFTMEYRLRRADGAYRWLYDNGTPRYTPNGQFAGYVGSCIDITARIEAEQERENLLVREKLAREEAERLSRLKDEFLATISHELRTPMNSITGWADLLQEGGLSPQEVNEAVNSIYRNSKIQNQLIADILDMSRIITGKLKLEMDPVDLEDIIHDTAESVHLAANAKNIAINLDIDPSVGPVVGDATRLQQVLWNLVSNAIKFTPARGTIQIKLTRVGNIAEIMVCDSGEGISKEFLPYVFDRFRQASGDFNRRHGGLGLGLSIVKHLVELHGGTVDAESPGLSLGSTFTIHLPAATVKLSPDHHDNQSVTKRARNTMLQAKKKDSLDGVRVLLVDDHKDVHLLVSYILRRHSADVSTATSVREAWEILQTKRPDIILSDIGMPEETGFDFIRRLRALSPSEGGKIPVIALTAHVREEDRQRTLASGFEDHIGKPIDTKVLVRTVAKLVRRSKRTESPQSL
jgi:PAS domain S-box-containing protein